MYQSKEALREYLEYQSWDAFFTATFAKHQRYSQTAIKKVVDVLHDPRLRPTKLFVAAEQHRLGGWHCHGLMEFPRRDTGEVFHGDIMLTLRRNNLSRLGFNKVDIVSNLNACSVYLSKYLVKDEWHGDWRMVGRKKFWQRAGSGITTPALGG